MNLCERCGHQFSCGLKENVPCWCKSMPPLNPIPSQFQECLCPDCLMTFKKPDATKPEQNLIEGEDYYLENNLFVFTKNYHLKKGYCCNNDCRHCPYK